MTRQLNLKIKDGIEPAVLLNYGFAPKYDEDTGEIKEYIKNDKNKKNTFKAKSFFQKLFEDDSEYKKYESFKEIFERWLDYKTTIKKQYKTENGLTSAFMGLIKLANNNVESAVELVEYAINKEWAGIYALPKSAKKAQQIEQCQSNTDWESRCMQ